MAVNPGKSGSNRNQLHPRHRGFLAYVTTRGFARFGVCGDDVAFTLARIFSLAIVGRSRSLAGALTLARVCTEAFDLRRLGGRARRVLGTYQAGGESQCDRGREHRSCYPGLLHRGDLLSSLKSATIAALDLWRVLSIQIEVLKTSNLKITFACFRALRLPGFDLHRFDLVVDLAEPMLKLRGFDLHADVATLADDMSFAVLFDFAHQQRVLEAALRAGNVYRFVFKHIRTSRRSYKILRRSRSSRIAHSKVLQIRASRQTGHINRSNYLVDAPGLEPGTSCM